MEGDVGPRQCRARVEADPSLRRGRVQHRWGVDHHVSRRGVTEALRVGDGHPRGERPRLRVGVRDRLAGGVRGRPAVAEVPDVGQVARRLRVGTAGGRERDLVADRGRGRVGGRLRLRRGVHRSPAAATATATAGVLGVVGVARAARIGREVDERVAVVVDPVIALRRRRRRFGDSVVSVSLVQPGSAGKSMNVSPSLSTPSSHCAAAAGFSTVVVGVARAARVGREVDERRHRRCRPRRRTAARRSATRWSSVSLVQPGSAGKSMKPVTVVVDPVVALRAGRVRRLGGVGVARAARVGREVDERVTVVVDPVIALRGGGSATRWCRCRSCSPGRPGSR